MMFYCLFFQDATGGHGADVIIEMLANASLSKDLKLVANKGRIGVMDHFPIHSIGLDLACNGGSCGGISLKRESDKILQEIEQFLFQEDKNLVPE